MVFVIRELLIGIFRHTLEVEMLYALSALVLVLGVVRTASIVFYEQEKVVARDQPE